MRSRVLIKGNAMLRTSIAALSVAVAAAAFAGTVEDDLVQWAAANKPLADSGQISQLDFYKELHRRIAETSAAEYRFKAENLRFVDRRIDILEAEAQGKITHDQALRKIDGENAEAESADERKRAQAEADAQRMAELRERAAAAAQAQDDAQRRAIAAQMLLGGFGRIQMPQVPVYQMPIPHTTQCRSVWIGGALQTTCN